MRCRVLERVIGGLFTFSGIVWLAAKWIDMQEAKACQRDRYNHRGLR